MSTAKAAWGGLMRVGLIRCLSITDKGYYRKHDVGQPRCQHWWEAGIDGECGRNGLEKDISKRQCQSYAEIHSHAALSLSCRERGSDDGQDEGRKRRGYSFIVLHLILHHISRTTVYLLGNVLFQLRRRESFLLAFGVDQVGWFHLYHGILARAARDVLLQALQLTNLPIGKCPMVFAVRDGVILHICGGHVGNEFLLLKLVETESIAMLPVVVVMLDVGNDTRSHLQLHILRRRVLFLVLVHRLEVLLDHGSVRDDISRKVIRQGGKKHARHHVRPQQALKRDACRQQGYHLRVACQLGREEYHGYEDEQRAEEVGEVRNEVGVIVEDNGAQRSMVFRELGQVLINVEDYGNGEYQGYREEICSDKLLDDIPVHPLDVTEGVEIFKHSQKTQFSANPFKYPLKQTRVVGRPPKEAMQPSWMRVHPPSCLVEPPMFPYLTITLHTQPFSLSPLPQLRHDTVFPLHEVAGEDVFSRVGDKPQVERQVVNARYLHGE